eukprot:CAMPEP_0179065474 /NCGR_PEP_ID=MMETSP0796-20121207/28479_1 /TAXON_ID=73915 /ORGANISM="Pyrodinium bahamense, Strain pbaha01" /LENGTH=193 /DNA_ID=CAMNT_0020762447 /DNA_START=38 /DNA_END=619 /DNA_ORIENTATION=+
MRTALTVLPVSAGQEVLHGPSCSKDPHNGTEDDDAAVLTSASASGTRGCFVSPWEHESVRCTTAGKSTDVIMTQALPVSEATAATSSFSATATKMVALATATSNRIRPGVQWGAPNAGGHNPTMMALRRNGVVSCTFTRKQSAAMSLQASATVPLIVVRFSITLALKPCAKNDVTHKAEATIEDECDDEAHVD